MCDPTSGFVGVNRDALQVFSRSFPLEYPEIEALVVLQRRAFRFLEIPCRMRPRMAGRSTITALRSIGYIFHVLMGVFANVLKVRAQTKEKGRAAMTGLLNFLTGVSLILLAMVLYRCGGSTSASSIR